jgi:hypothetical protein
MLKSYSELDASHQLAWKMGASSAEPLAERLIVAERRVEELEAALREVRDYVHDQCMGQIAVAEAVNMMNRALGA